MATYVISVRDEELPAQRVMIQANNEDEARQRGWEMFPEYHELSVHNARGSNYVNRI